MPVIIINSPVTENNFWLQIMGDHARFIVSSISPLETEEIENAKPFIPLFDSLLTKSKEQLTDEQMMQLNEQSFQSAQDIRKLILHLIGRQLTENIIINRTPLFMNHMVNETEEYLNILGAFVKKKALKTDSVHLDLLWLLDGYGHALTISDSVEATYKDRKKAASFAEEFDALRDRTIEMSGYLRTGKTDFPSLTQLNYDAGDVMRNFAEFLLDLNELVRGRKILGSIFPLLIDHFYREDCYFINQLSKVSDVKVPYCDPASPRKE